MVILKPHPKKQKGTYGDNESSSHETEGEIYGDNETSSNETELTNGDIESSFHMVTKKVFSNKGTNSYIESFFS